MLLKLQSKIILFTIGNINIEYLQANIYNNISLQDHLPVMVSVYYTCKLPSDIYYSELSGGGGHHKNAGVLMTNVDRWRQ